MTDLLERQVDAEMLRLYHMTGEATGHWANRYLQKARKVGGLQTAREALKSSAGLAPGLLRLAIEYRLDLSLEYLVLQPPWCELFTPDELRVARERLSAARKTRPDR